MTLRKKRIDKFTGIPKFHASPLVLVTTRSLQGIDNIAPFGMCMPISGEPPLYAIGVHPSRDTYRNIVEKKEFAINLVSPIMKDACLKAAKPLPPMESEFEITGLTRFQGSKIDASLILESPVNFECRMCWMKNAGDHDIVVGEVLSVWVDEKFCEDDIMRMRLNYDDLYHIGMQYYFKRGERLI